MLVIDGSEGEGGGQILRTSIALSAITGKPVQITNIRKNRPGPGLAAQHLTSIKAVGELCNAELKGLAKGSTELEFVPNKIKSGSFSFDIGTAGSITLVLQACLPVALHSSERSEFTLHGGTDVKFSPPIDYFRFVLSPLIELTGARINILNLKRGYYPKGGGILSLEIIPPETEAPGSLNLPEQGKIKNYKGFIHSANLPGHITRRLESSVRTEFKMQFGSDNLDLQTESVPNSLSAGVGVSLWTEATSSAMGSNALGERGIPAEKLANIAVSELFEDLQSGAAVDRHAVDQLLIFLALDGGCFLTRRPLNAHSETNINVIEQFLGKIFRISDEGNLIKISSGLSL